MSKVKTTQSTIRPATQSDINKFPALNGRSVRAYIVEKEGKIQAIAGVMYEEVIQGFSMQDDDISPKDIVRLTRKGLDILENIDLPVYVIPSNKYKTSRSFITRLGFKNMGNGRWMR